MSDELLVLLGSTNAICGECSFMLKTDYPFSPRRYRDGLECYCPNQACHMHLVKLRVYFPALKAERVEGERP